MIRSKGEKKEARDDQHHKPDQLVQAAVARWRKNQFEGFHERHTKALPKSALPFRTPRAVLLSQKQGPVLTDQ